MNVSTVAPSPRVIAVTVNWNRPDDTIECVRSLAQQRPPPPVIVVDNGSRDDSRERIQHACPQVELIAAERNLGFAGGYNLGIRRALAHGAEFVLMLNNDTIAAPTMLQTLLCHAREDADIFAPAIFYHDAPERIWSVGGGIDPVLMEMRGAHGRRGPLPAAPTAREFLSGCALLVRREAFARVGFFDERFFMYYEDLDFCLRARERGVRMLLVPEAKLWHKVSQSSGGADSPNERYHMALSSGRYFRKHMRGWQWLVIPPYRLMSGLRWSLHLAARRAWPALGAYWRGLLRGWLHE